MDKFVKFVFALFLMVSGMGVSKAQGTALPSQLDLYSGQVVVYSSNRPLARVAVGNGDLIEVTTIEKRQLVVIAGADASGFTTLHLWYEDGGQRSIDVNISGANPSATAASVRQMLGPESAAEIMDIGGKVVIYGELTPGESKRLEAIKEIYPAVVDLSSADMVGMQPMVLMDVRVMEFKTDALRELGIRWDSVIDGPNAGALYDSSSSEFRVLPDGSPFGGDEFAGLANPMQTAFGLATSITSRINLLTQNGDAYELAAPQLSARSGGAATFLAGGEIPIPKVGPFGQTTVEYKDYGIKLDIQPVVNSNNEVSALVMTEISKIDPAVTVQGVPGFLTRRAQTEFNVQAGQTMVISGLVDVQGSKGIAGIPGLANIPILGRLFRSDNFRAGRTDLVVFVTPRIINADHPANIDAIQKSNRMLEDFEKTFGAEIFD